MFLAGAIALGFALIRIVAFIVKRRPTLFVFTNTRLYFSHLHRPIEALILAGCVAVGVSQIRFPKEIVIILDYAVHLWIIAALGWLLLKIADAIRDTILGRYDISAKDNLAARRVHTQLKLIHHVVAALVVIFTIAFMLLLLPKVKQIGVGLVASAGVAGIILGFAAQKLLGNVMAGIQLAFAQPIRLEDAVIVENEFGWIEDISLLYVIVRLWDLRRMVLPVSYFIEKPFQNWTRVSANLLGTVCINVDYSVPVDEVRNELTRILTANPDWDKKANVLQVTNTDNRSVELRALMSAADSSLLWNLRCDVREKLLQFLQRTYPGSLPQIRMNMLGQEKWLPSTLENPKSIAILNQKKRLCL